MKNDINNYEFDFEAEVEALQRKLGAQADDLLFLDVTVTGTEEDPGVNLRHSIGNKDVHGEDSLLTAEQYAIFFYLTNPYESSQTMHFYENEDGALRGKAIALREREYLNERLGDEDRALMRLWILYHEAAHTQGFPGTDDDDPFVECVADGFAALSFLQRFGPAAADFISRFSWSRSFEAVLGDSSRLTTITLDKIIADSHREDFSNLSLEETLARAEAYAREWSPSPEILAAANPVIQRGKDLELDLIAKTCFSSPDAFAFYIGAKFFQPFLHPEGVIFNDEPVTIPAPHRELLTAEVAARADNMSLSEVFGKHSTRPATPIEPSISEMLKVAAPPRPRPFTVNHRFSL